MPITNADIKLRQSERLTDNDDGGGRMTGAEVVDGQVNNLFPDISRLDRTLGRVNMRKAFLHVDTATVDTYFGSHAIVDDAPDDPNVSVVMFSRDDHADERAQAQSFVESYVVAGPESQLRLLGNQLTGQMTINCWARPGARLPDIGDVLVLSIEDAGDPGNGTQQFVRIVDRTIDAGRVFTDTVGGNVIDFEADVIALSTSAPLNSDFPGGQPKRDFASGSTKVRETQVAQAARYYGVRPLAQDVAPGDTTIWIDTPFTQIVPTTTSEQAQTDLLAGGNVTHEETFAGAQVEVLDQAHTASDSVTLAIRGMVWTRTLIPAPAPGSVRVDFRALGKWQRLADDGTGNLTGDGGGSVDYGTGSVSVTLAAMPDVDTEILWAWGTPGHYVDRTGEAGVAETPAVELVPASDMAPGSIAISWTAGGVPKSATDDGAGALTGDATGIVIYSGDARSVFLRPSAVPDSNSTYALDYDAGAAQAHPVTVAQGTLSFTLPGAPISPGSVALKVSFKTPWGSASSRVITDDGVGGFLWPDGTAVSGATIDCTTGAVTIRPVRTNISYRTYR